MVYYSIVYRRLLYRRLNIDSECCLGCLSYIKVDAVAT